MFAKVCIPNSPVHLGESFDYQIPVELEGKIQFGSLVEILFNGRIVCGYVVAITDKTNFLRQIKSIDKLLSAKPLFDQGLFEVYSSIAKFYGTLVNDILNIAIPKQSKRVENQHASQTHIKDTEYYNLSNSDAEIAKYPELLNELKNKMRIHINSPFGVEGNIPRYFDLLAQIALDYAKNDLNLIIVLPTLNQVQLMHDALIKYLSPTHFAVMGGFEKPSENYRSYLRIRDHNVNIAFGTPQVAFAPFKRLDLVIVVNDLDIAHKDLRFPYYHSREVLLNRTILQKCGYMSIGIVPSLYTMRLIGTKYLKMLTYPSCKTDMPDIEFINSNHIATKRSHNMQIPDMVMAEMKNALESGTILVIVPRKGFIPLLSCASCLEILHCQFCQANLKMTQNSELICTKCHQINISYKCPKCNSTKLRAVQKGSELSAYELGRMFAGAVVKESSSNKIIHSLENKKNTIVVSTVGSETIVKDGYNLTVFLDVDALTYFDAIDVEVDLLNVLIRGASLTKSTGKMIVVGNVATQISNSVLLNEPTLYLSQVLKDRKTHHFPPYARVAVVVAQSDIIDFVQNNITLDCFDVIGPFDINDTSYAKIFSSWIMRVNNSMHNKDKKDIECLVIRTPISKSFELANQMLLLRRRLSLEHRNFNGHESLKILFDPKEFL